MSEWILIMVLASGELVHSQVKPTDCLEYAARVTKGDMPDIEGTRVLWAVCGPASAMAPKVSKKVAKR